MCDWDDMQDDDHDAEEWERYEALHEDVDKQVITLYYIHAVYMSS